MGIVSRLTRTERKRLTREIRRTRPGNRRSALKRRLRLLRTATLDRGKLRLGGKLQRTSAEVARRLVSGKSRTVKEAVKELSSSFAQAVAQRTIDNKIRDLKIKREKGLTRQDVLKSQALARLQNPDLFFGTKVEKRADIARKKTAGEIIREGRRLAKQAEIDPNIAIGILGKRRLEIQRGKARAGEFFRPQLRESVRLGISKRKIGKVEKATQATRQAVKEIIKDTNKIRRNVSKRIVGKTKRQVVNLFLQKTGAFFKDFGVGTKRLYTEVIGVAGEQTGRATAIRRGIDTNKKTFERIQKKIKKVGLSGLDKNDTIDLRTSVQLIKTLERDLSNALGKRKTAIELTKSDRQIKISVSILGTLAALIALELVASAAIGGIIKVGGKVTAKIAAKKAIAPALARSLRAFSTRAGKATVTGIKVFDTLMTFGTARQFLKKPNIINSVALAYYASPTAWGIMKSLGKLSPKFRPSVKNVNSTLDDIVKILKRDNDLLSKTANKRERFFLKRRIKADKQAIKELRWINNNKQVLKFKDFNPQIYTKNFKKLQGSYQTGFHVSTQANLKKLFGQKIQKPLGVTRTIIDPLEKQLKFKGVETRLNKLVSRAKIKQPIPKRFKGKNKLQRQVLKVFKEKGVITGGAVALNLQVPFFRRRKTLDIDGKTFSGKAKQILQLVTNKFKKGKFNVLPGGNPGTFKIVSSKNPKKALIELTNIKPGKLRKGDIVKTKKGLFVESKISLLKGKANTLSKVNRFSKKGTKDLGDFLRLSDNVFKKSTIIPKRKNPSKVFEVVNQPGGMGKDRMRFGETHMYFDFDIPIGYSKGKPFSIIKFPLTKINKFPKALNKQVNLASRGLLNGKQQIALRTRLNTYIKNNPNKFFLSPRTGSLPIGEREIALAETSKFFKRDVYKTFDNDLQSFISIVEVGFKKGKKTSLLRKIKNSWKSRPFRTLRLRLTNPDIRKVRQFRRILERDTGFNRIKNKFLGLVNKMLRSRKAQVGVLPLSRTRRIRKFKAKVKKVPTRVKARVRKKKRVRPRISLKKGKRKPSKARKPPKRIRIVAPKRKKVRVRKPTRISKRVRTKPRVKKRIVVRKRVKPRKRVPIKKRVRKKLRKRKLRKRMIKKRAKVPVRVKPKAKIPAKKKPPLKPPVKITPQKVKRIKRKKIKRVDENLPIFLSDFISFLEGITATPAERRAFLKVGRVFTGLERRKLI